MRDKDEKYMVEICRLEGERDFLQNEVTRLREALTPSADTKAAYSGEVYDWGCDECGDQFVSWIAIKDIMQSIRNRATECKDKN
jgi:hypothetical protein